MTVHSTACFNTLVLIVLLHFGELLIHLHANWVSPPQKNNNKQTNNTHTHSHFFPLSIVFHQLCIAFKPHFRQLNGSESSLLWAVVLSWKKNLTLQSAMASGVGWEISQLISKGGWGEKYNLESGPLRVPFNQIHPNLTLIRALFSKAKY